MRRLPGIYDIREKSRVVYRASYVYILEDRVMSVYIYKSYGSCQSSVYIKNFWYSDGDYCFDVLRDIRRLRGNYKRRFLMAHKLLIFDTTFLIFITGTITGHLYIIGDFTKIIAHSI